MKRVTTIGLDIAKRVFQVHGIDEDGQIVVQKQLSRRDVFDWFGKLEPCLIGIEACATATYWAREIGKLGHDVRLIPPTYVKPYVRRQKNDRADAAAICEAVGRPSMRFVAVKTLEQQEIQVLHRTRDLLITQRVRASNALRAHLAEFGVVFPLGDVGVTRAMAAVKEGNAPDLPVFLFKILRTLVDQIEILKGKIAELDRHMRDWHRDHADSCRLTTIPGIGVTTATALIGAIGNGRHFKSAREFSAWLGLVPRQSSSGGKDKLGRISKRGNANLRSLLVVGATAMLRGRMRDKTAGGAWFGALLLRKPPRVATVALANKMARIAWALLTKGEVFRRIPVAVAPAAA